MSPCLAWLTSALVEATRSSLSATLLLRCCSLVRCQAHGQPTPSLVATSIPASPLRRSGSDGANLYINRFTGVQVSEFSFDADFAGNIEADFLVCRPQSHNRHRYRDRRNLRGLQLHIASLRALT